MVSKRHKRVADDYIVIDYTERKISNHFVAIIIIAMSTLGFVFGVVAAQTLLQ